MNPGIEAHRGLRLTGFLQEHLFLRARFEPIGLLAEAVGPRIETILQGNPLIETSPLEHGALLSLGERRERNRAFSSPIVTSSRAVMPENVRPQSSAGQ
ncbi:hypothetical protein ACWX0K_17260 [Nitrobacteraceae bacterium UC4446_H13]